MSKFDQRMKRVESLCTDLKAYQYNAESLRRNAQAFRGSSCLHPILMKRLVHPQQQHQRPATAPRWEYHPLFPTSLVNFKKLNHNRTFPHPPHFPRLSNIIFSWPRTPTPPILRRASQARGE